MSKDRTMIAKGQGCSRWLVPIADNEKTRISYYNSRKNAEKYFGYLRFWGDGMPEIEAVEVVVSTHEVTK